MNTVLNYVNSPIRVLRHLRELSAQVLEDEAQSDPLTAKVYQSFKAFSAQAAAWHRVSEQAYMNARSME